MHTAQNLELDTCRFATSALRASSRQTIEKKTLIMLFVGWPQPFNKPGLLGAKIANGRRGEFEEGQGKVGFRNAIKRVRGITLLEVIIAAAIVAMVAMTTMLMMSYARVQTQKAADRSLMLDFAYHYLELARALPYASVQPGQPINLLYDGTRPILLPDGTQTTVNIRFPTNSTTWNSLLTNDFRFFHPPLARLTGREPQYRVRIDTQTTAGVERARRIRLEMRWRAPLLRSAGDWQTLDVDTIVYPEFH